MIVAVTVFRHQQTVGTAAPRRSRKRQTVQVQEEGDEGVEHED